MDWFIPRFNSPNYSEPNGGWKWVDGSTLNYDGNSFTEYQNWYPNNNQPDDQNGNQNVGTFNHVQTGFWDDAIQELMVSHFANGN